MIARLISIDVVTPARSCALFIRSVLALSVVALAPQAASPVVDAQFGANGVARLNVMARTSDAATAAFQQADGKLVVAGTSRGNSSVDPTVNFVLRFNPAGKLDATFGQGGVVLFDPSFVSGTLRQVEQRADGSLLVAGSGDRFFMLRLDHFGSVDMSFGTNGLFYSNVDGQTWFVQQPDGRILLVNGVDYKPELRLSRVSANGAPDATLVGTNGPVVITVPAGYGFYGWPVGDGQGGFIAPMIGTVQAPTGDSARGQFLLARLTPAGALDASFGNAGIVLGAALGAPLGDFKSVARAPNGKWFVLMTASPDFQTMQQTMLVRLDD